MPPVPRALYLLLGDLATYLAFDRFESEDGRSWRGPVRWPVVAGVVAVHLWMSAAVKPEHAVVDVAMRCAATHDMGHMSRARAGMLATTVLAFAATESVWVAAAGVAATTAFAAAESVPKAEMKSPFRFVTSGGNIPPKRAKRT